MAERNKLQQEFADVFDETDPQRFFFPQALLCNMLSTSDKERSTLAARPTRRRSSEKEFQESYRQLKQWEKSGWVQRSSAWLWD